MKTYEYTVYLSSPLVLTTSSADENTMQSKDYIPGSVLLGALAGQHRKMTVSEEQFYNFFLSEKVRFGNGFISEDGETTFSAPMSIHKEKALENYFFFPEMSEDEKRNHPSTKSLPGYISINDHQITKHNVEKGLHFHINTEKQNEEDDVRIFHYEFIQRGQTFKGLVRCSDELSGDLEAFLDQISSLRLGRSKNTEYGKVTFSYKAVENNVEPKLHKDQITLFFKSPVILRNENGYFVASEELLINELGFANNEVDIPHKFFRIETFENFRSIWGMKMPSTTAFKAGCTFTLKFKNGVSDSQKAKLKHILNNGIGYRKNEGFGEVDQLNLTLSKLTLVTRETTKKTLTKPDKQPEFMKKVIRQITTKTIEQIVDEKVMRDATGFGKIPKYIPSNSLLSKIDFMIKDSDSFETFKTLKVKELREKATNQLKKCRKDAITLYELLTDESHIRFEIEKDSKWLPQIEEKAKDFKYQKSYISGLMRRLRKFNKANKDGDNK